MRLHVESHPESVSGSMFVQKPMGEIKLFTASRLLRDAVRILYEILM